MQNEFNRDSLEIGISLFTNEDILALSMGEVKKPDTYNYKTLKPTMGGLFCPIIFGNQAEYECYCKRLVGRQYKDITCEKCHVTVNNKWVLRKRFGHIELCKPIAIEAIVIPILCKIFNVKSKILKAAFQGMIHLSYDPSTKSLVPDFVSGYKYNWGLYDLFKQINTSDFPSYKKLLERHSTFGDLWNKRILVVPMEYRPVLIGENKDVIFHDLSSFYKEIIYANNRASKLLIQNSTSYITPFLLDESMLRMSNTVQDLYKKDSPSGLKSIMDYLSGKKGFIRSKHLGKNIDFMSRGVASTDPNLKLWEAGIPRKSLIEIFKPLIINRLVDKGIFVTKYSFKKVIEEYYFDIDNILIDLSSKYKILINRAPSLHRLSIQAFSFQISDNNTISVNPLICKALGLDFDGDEINVMLPITDQAQKEINEKMYRNNIYNYSYENIIANITREILLMFYVYSKVRNTKNPIKISSIFEANDDIYLPDESILNKTYSLNGTLLSAFHIYIAKKLKQNFNLTIDLNASPINTKEVNQWIQQISVSKIPVDEFLDYIKDIGYQLNVLHGCGLEIDAYHFDKGKINENIDKTIELTQKTLKLKNNALINSYQADQENLKNWELCIAKNQEITKQLINDWNSNSLMSDIAESKVRGSWDSLVSMSSMGGISSDANYVPFPHACYNSNINGFTPVEMFMISQEARRNFAIKANRSAADGYFTRKITLLCFNKIVREGKCDSKEGFWLNKNEAIGSYTVEDSILITDQNLNKFTEYIKVRSPATCNYDKNEVCQYCFGNIINKLVDPETNIGILAAQALSEGGTQLGIATKKDRMKISASDYRDILLYKGTRIVYNSDLVISIPGGYKFVENSIIFIYEEKSGDLINFVEAYSGSIISYKTDSILSADCTFKQSIFRQIHSPYKGVFKIESVTPENTPSIKEGGRSEEEIKEIEEKILVMYVGDKRIYLHKDTYYELHVENGNKVSKDQLLVSIFKERRSTDAMRAYEQTKGLIERESPDTQKSAWIEDNKSVITTQIMFKNNNEFKFYVVLRSEKSPRQSVFVESFYQWGIDSDTYVSVDKSGDTKRLKEMASKQNTLFDADTVFSEKQLINNFGPKFYFYYISDTVFRGYLNSGIKIKRQYVDILLSYLIQGDSNEKLSEILNMTHNAKDPKYIHLYPLLSAYRQENSWIVSASFQKTFSTLLRACVDGAKEEYNTLFNRMFFNFQYD